MVIYIDSLEYDVKRALATSPDNQLQWHKIREELYEKYKKEYEDKNSFTTILHRRLQKLRNSGDIDKKNVGHQEVFYFIHKKSLAKIGEELDRELAHRRFDDVWNAFSPDQRKRELQNLLQQWQQLIAVVQNVESGILSSAKDLSELVKVSLENPTEDTKAKRPPAEREHLLRELQTVQTEIEEIETNIVRGRQQVVNQEGFDAQLKLYKEFVDLVVEPKYCGNWYGAIADLMRKAVEEQKQKKESVEP